MLLQAAQDFDIDLSQSLMFGDKELDIEAGQRAGCNSFYIGETLSTFAPSDAPQGHRIEGK